MEQLVFSRHSIRAVDQTTIEQYGVPGIVLMENAARGAADIALSMLGDPLAKRVLIVCGSGNNGGDGYAMARHLHNAGADVMLLPFGAARPGSDAATNAAICSAMKLPHFELNQLDQLGSGNDCALIVDAIFGTGLDREVTGDAAEIIKWINETERPVLAADLPSGMDCDTGETLGVAVRATRTATFGGVKIGFLTPAGKKLIGDVEVVDIGAPIEVLKRFGRTKLHA